MTDPFKLPTFPAADVFPMMADDELKDLAADIAENGLREPLVVAEIPNGDYGLTTMLVDGRNRRAACKMAGIVPTTRGIEGADATAYVLSANILRRHMTKGQRAIAVAMIHPEGQQGKKGTSLDSNEVGVSGGYIRQARTVLRSSPDLAAEVLAGAMSLDAAYQTIRQQAGEINNARTRMARLRESRPDLAELVSTEALKLDEAVARAKKEAEEDRQRRWAATMNIIDSVVALDRPSNVAADDAALYDRGIAQSRGDEVTPARLRRAADYLVAFADAMEEQDEKKI